MLAVPHYAVAAFPAKWVCRRRTLMRSNPTDSRSVSLAVADRRCAPHKPAAKSILSERRALNRWNRLGIS
jgi:hypothetical protein